MTNGLIEGSFCAAAKAPNSKDHAQVALYFATETGFRARELAITAGIAPAVTSHACTEFPEKSAPRQARSRSTLALFRPSATATTLARPG